MEKGQTQTLALVTMIIVAFLFWLQVTGKLKIVLQVITGTVIGGSAGANGVGVSNASGGGNVLSNVALSLAGNQRAGFVPSGGGGQEIRAKRLAMNDAALSAIGATGPVGAVGAVIGKALGIRLF